jgi:hypothetical protein
MVKETLRDVAVCPAGHVQEHTRPDRPGSCTRCGAPLRRGVVDDSLPKGKMDEKARFVLDEDEAEEEVKS